MRNTSLSSNSKSDSRSAPSALSIAVVGAGPFADAYAPLLQMFEEDISVMYVWSRSASSSHAIIGTNEPCMQGARAVYGSAGFQEIIHSPRVNAVVLILPPNVALSYAIPALAAGKCVLSEKPISNSVEQARTCVHKFRDLQLEFKVPPVWFVAENFRFEEVFVEAARLLPRLGYLLQLDMSVDTPLNARYFVSAWSRNQTQGAFLIDMSVHHMAALRLLAQAGSAGAPVSVKAETSDSGSGFATPDTTDGTILWESGLVASVRLCMVADKLEYKLTAVGLLGSLEITRYDWDQYKLKYKLRGDRHSTSRLFRVGGVQNEFRSFLHMTRRWQSGKSTDSDTTPKSTPRNRFELVQKQKTAEWRGRPEEGFHDLALVTAFVESGKMGETVQVETL